MTTIVGPLGVWDYDEDQNRAYDELKRRWTALFAWSEKSGKALPQNLVDAWRKFSKDWEGWFWKDLGSPIHPHDGTALRAAAHDLAAAEGAAQLQGYSSPDVPALTPEQRAPKGAPVAPAPVKAPTFDEEHRIASEIDKAAPKFPAPPDKPDPNFGIKAGVIGACAAATILTAATAKGDAARAGFALGGSVLTLAAGTLLFGDLAPKKEPKKDGT